MAAPVVSSCFLVHIMGAANVRITNRAVGHNHFALTADERDARIRDMLDEYMELKFVGFDDSGNLVFHVRTLWTSATLPILTTAGRSVSSHAIF